MELDDLLVELNRAKMSYDETTTVKAQIKTLYENLKKLENQQEYNITKMKDKLCQQFVFLFTDYFDKKSFEKQSVQDRFVREKGDVKFSLSISDKEEFILTLLTDIQDFHNSATVKVDIRETTVKQFTHTMPELDGITITLDNFGMVEQIKEMDKLIALKDEIIIYTDNYKLFWGKTTMHDYVYKIFDSDEITGVDDLIKKVLSIYEIWKNTRG